jgi:hypothetical protein
MQQGLVNQYLLITMDYFTKWPEANTIPSEEASTVAEELVTNFSTASNTVGVT